MQHKIFSILLSSIVILSMMASSCSNSNVVTKTQTITKTENQESTNTGNTYSFTDSAGRNVEIPYEINKIMPSGPVAQMMLIALAPEKLSALSTKLSESQKDYLPSYLFDLEYIGQLYGSADLNRETLAGIGCDLIIDLGEPKSTIVEDMDNLYNQTGIPSIHVTASIYKCGEAYRTLGKILGCEERANEIANYCDEICNNMLTIIRTTSNNKISAAYVIYNGDNSVNVIAKNSYQSEVFDLLFDNVAVVDNPSGKGTGNAVNLEQLLLWNPEVIIFSDAEGYEAVASGNANSVWYELDAIKNNKYYEMPSTPYSWFSTPPSVNRFIGIQWDIAMFYNNDYGVSVDINDAIKEYYKLFYSCDISDDAINSLLKNSYSKLD